ncbi:MAG: ATP-binding protein [Melioribacteraceae bacterium]
MGLSKQTEIGLVDSINGNIVSVKMADNIKSNIPIIEGIVYKVGQLGSFLKIPLGYTNLFGIVTQVGADAIPKNLKEIIAQDFSNYKNQQWLSIVLVGEQIGRKFERGITQFPTPGDIVHLVTAKDLEIIYGGFSESNSIVVGNISASENLPARIEIDKLISRHCAVLGSTGSGKSNCVAVLLNSLAEKGFNSARILVIDPHGEYSVALKDKCKVYKINATEEENSLFIPFWAFPFEQLLEIFSKKLLDTNEDYIRQKILNSKLESNGINNLNINEWAISADTPIPFSINKLWGELDDFEKTTFEADRITKCLTKAGDFGNLIGNEYEQASTTNTRPFFNSQRKGILYFTDIMRNKLKDNRYNFLFNPKEYKPDSEGKCAKDLNDLLFEWFDGKKPITILDLSGVPPEITQTISGTLLKLIFDSLFWGQNLNIGGKEQPLLIVLEEAHSYLKAGEDSISSKTVQNIAKEGRKYGVGLMLVTQRPSELDETVLSQCGTMIALRMNNSKDRGHIKSAIQDELQTIVDLLPSLRTGEGIISGEAVKIPSRVKFYKSSNAPKGSDPKASEKWKLVKKDAENEYKTLVNLWRNQQFKMEEINDEIT